MIRARVIAAAGFRELLEALPWSGQPGALARRFPARAVVLDGLGPAAVERLVSTLREHSIDSVWSQSAVAWAADPDGLARILGALRDDPASAGVFQAASSALSRWSEPPHDVALSGEGALRLSDRVHVMGIVNVTPDSFSDGGRFLEAPAAIDHGLALADAGADVLDIGGESSRPGAEPVGEQEELRRVLPVVETLAAKTGLPISVDTMKSSVARGALDAGARIVNDVSAGRDPEMFPLVAQRHAAIVLMHMRGEPRTMQSDIHYGDVVAEISSYLDERSRAALDAGVTRDRILVDPGFGFGKLVEHNLVLLRRLREFRCLGFPVVAGTSRKTFISKVLGDVPVDEREAGTAATVALAVWNGAAMVRVHDVRAARHVVHVAEAVMRVQETGG